MGSKFRRFWYFDPMKTNVVNDLYLININKLDVFYSSNN